MLSPGRGKPGMFTPFELLVVVLLVALLLAAIFVTVLVIR